jgi:hypothetical protein
MSSAMRLMYNHHDTIADVHPVSSVHVKEKNSRSFTISYEKLSD